MGCIHGDILQFLYKSIINDKYGICTADVIEYNGLCQTYITAKHSCKPHCGICRKDKGKLKRKGGEVLK